MMWRSLFWTPFGKWGCLRVLYLLWSLLKIFHFNILVKWDWAIISRVLLAVGKGLLVLKVRISLPVLKCFGILKFIKVCWSSLEFLFELLVGDEEVSIESAWSKGFVEIQLVYWSQEATFSERCWDFILFYLVDTIVWYIKI